MGFTNQGDLSALRDYVTSGKEKGSQRKWERRERQIFFFFFAVVLLFSQFLYLELDMINIDVPLLYVSMDHKGCNWTIGFLVQHSLSSLKFC